MTTENPFVDSRRKIEQEYFIGREEESNNNIIVNIEDSIFTPKLPLNLAIIGIPGIGKGSLAHNAIYERKEELIEKRVVPIWLHVALYEDRQQFLSSLVSNCAAEMEKLGWLTDSLQNSAEAIKKTMQSDQDVQDEIRSFFSKVKDASYSTLFILNRFDHAGTIFKGNATFQLLGELANGDSYRLSLVLTSHQTIAKVEEHAGSTSPFSKLFTNPIWLAMFNNTDLDTYFSKFSDVRISISDDDRKRILSYCGTHPYLLQVLGHQIVRRYHKTGEIDVDGTATDNQYCFSSYYQALTDFLEMVKLLDSLLQILFNFSDDVKQTYKNELKELEKYGLIKSIENGTYIAYSEHFYNYLRELHQGTAKTLSISTSAPEPLDFNHHADKSVEEIASAVNEALKSLTSMAAVSTATDAGYKPETSLGDLWEETERALRKLIVTIMSNQHCKNWFESLKENNNLLYKVFEHCVQNQNSSTYSLPGINTVNLFNFANQTDLFNIILDNSLWNRYFRSFLKNKSQWESYKEFMIPCRHLIRHSISQETLTELHSGMFRLCCKNILETAKEVEVRISTTTENSPQVQGEEEPREPDQTVVSAGTPDATFQPSVPTGTQEGVVNFVTENGWGRIRPSTCSPDHKDGIYVHVSDYPELMDCQNNQEVKFEIKNTDKGWNAINVSLVRSG